MCEPTPLKAAPIYMLCELDVVKNASNSHICEPSLMQQRIEEFLNVLREASSEQGISPKGESPSPGKHPQLGTAIPTAGLEAMHISGDQRT